MAMYGAENVREVFAAARTTLLRLVREESGQDLIEYALVAALVGLGAVVSMRTLSTKIGSAFTTIGTSLTSNV
jgi:pilus assembly protein Flp/PilA